MNKVTLGALQNNLRDFGLNPMDWTVFWLKGAHFIALGKTSPQLILAGSAVQTQETWEWSDLELVLD